MSETTTRVKEPEDLASSGKGSRRGVVVTSAITLAALTIIASMLVISDSLIVGLLGILALMLLMALRIPVAASLAVIGVIGTWTIAGNSVAIDTLTNPPFSTASSWSLSVLPMFILMSYLLSNSGATTRIYNVARAWLGWAPGGLALTTIFAGAGFSAISGSSVTIAYALGKVGLPEMFRSGYDQRLALGTVMMSGTMGNLIPPSILLVVYAGIAEVPIGPALLAGLLPGILLALLFAILVMTWAVLKPSLVGGNRKARAETIRASGVSPYSRGRTIIEVLPVLAVIFIVVGGIYAGFFTATEAGAVGVIASGILAFGYLRKNFLRTGASSLLQAATSTASIFFLLIGAMIFNRMLTLSGVARWVGDYISGITAEPLVFLLLVGLIFLILGFFMESTSIILITIPMFLPIALTFGIDPIWFGVYAVVLVEIGMVTPPLGLLTFTVHSIAQDPAVNLGQKISLGEVFRSALMFLPAPLALVIILLVFPQITTVLGGGAS